MRKFLAPAASLYGFAVRVREAAYSQGWLRARELDRPVVCVGNLTVGGSGKTPLVAAIAGILIRRGFKPGILTRGYGRHGGPSLIALAPAAQREPDPRQVGDEPALLARALPGVPMVICSNRYLGGRLAEEKFGVNVHVLDDGFQHFALRRKVDVVALDATQPVLASALLPVGRLREPVSGLRRAHLIVLTRADSEDTQALEQRLLQINPHARVFRSRTELKGILEIASGQILPRNALLDKMALAFCGIGNPEAFFHDLDRWGISIAGVQKFPDHHVYTEEEVAKLGQWARQSGAAALVTTEKDAMNLPPNRPADLPLLACRIETEILESERFEEALMLSLENSG